MPYEQPHVALGRQLKAAQAEIFCAAGIHWSRYAESGLLADQSRAIARLKRDGKRASLAARVAYIATYIPVDTSSARMVASGAAGNYDAEIASLEDRLRRLKAMRAVKSLDEAKRIARPA